MVNNNSKVDECPFCHSKDVKRVENDKFDDLFFCEGCNHRFRYDPTVNFTSKSIDDHHLEGGKTE
jgi:ribosomal protein L37AE/L43A